MSTSNDDQSQLYDDIVSDYAAIKTNVYKTQYEEPTFWKLLGDVENKDILDLACGSGHYTRVMKQKGAKNVVGVDISKEMIAAAVAQEENDSLGIQYSVGDATKYSFQGDNSAVFDVVTAQYLLCYADTKASLREFCHTAFIHTKSNGRFLTMTTICKEDNSPDHDPVHGCTIEPVNSENDGKTGWYDGVKVKITLFSGDMKKKCSFPNHAWSRETVKSVLLDVGFDKVEDHCPVETVPVVFFTAFKT